MQISIAYYNKLYFIILIFYDKINSQSFVANYLLLMYKKNISLHFYFILYYRKQFKTKFRYAICMCNIWNPCIS